MAPKLSLFYAGDFRSIGHSQSTESSNNDKWKKIVFRRAVPQVSLLPYAAAAAAAAATANVAAINGTIWQRAEPVAERISSNTNECFID